MTGFEFDEPPTFGVNKTAAPVVCETCGGDRYITVLLRPPTRSLLTEELGIQSSKVSFDEEVAPCWECNRAAYAGLRIDPARAQELHRSRR